MIDCMGIRKVSVSLDEQAAAVAEKLAALEGLSLSAWLSRAAIREARIADGLVAVTEWEAEHAESGDADTAVDQAEFDRAAAALAAPAVRAEYRAALERLYSGQNDALAKRRTA